jgi:hypothetical protein
MKAYAVLIGVITAANLLRDVSFLYGEKKFLFHSADDPF